MAPRGIKAAKLTKRGGSQAKVIEWVTKEYSRGPRDIPVEVSTPKRKKARRYSNSGEGNSKSVAASHEDLPPSMDVDEAFWTEEPVIEEEKKVSTPIRPSSMAFDMFAGLSNRTWRTLSLGLVLTCIVSSVLRVYQLQRHANFACLLHLNGGAQTASLLLYSARVAAGNPTEDSLSTGFRSGRGHTLLHLGCGRLG
jgi:hypothetical protein